MEPLPPKALRAETGGSCALATARGPGPGALYILLLGLAPPSPRAVATRAPPVDPAEVGAEARIVTIGTAPAGAIRADAARRPPSKAGQ